MKEFELKLKESDVKVIGDALLELPAKDSLEVINKINAQLMEQFDSESE